MKAMWRWWVMLMVSGWSLSAGLGQAHAGFTGSYDESQWTLNAHGGDGQVDWSTDLFYLDSGYTGSGTMAQADLTVRVPKAGTIYFEWAFFGSTQAGYRFARLKNGTPTVVTSRQDYDEGTNSFSVAAGDIVGFRVTAPKDGDFSSFVSISAFFAPGQEPAILVQPRSVITCTGELVSYEVVATNAYSYQWQFKGQDLADETMEALDVRAVSPADSGSYRVIVRNPLGSVTSQSVQLSIHGPPVLAPQGPSSLLRRVGENVVFSASASGTNLHYQWRRNAQDIPGASAPSFSLTNLNLADSGQYSVRVRNGCGEVVGNATTLVVTNELAGQVFLKAVRGAGELVELEVQAPGGHYLLESSTNLWDWSLADTNRLLPGQAWAEQPGGQGRRFYRVKAAD